jgi:ketosteroid isomerase-like protein
MPASATEQDIRAALLQHWAASDANDFLTEHQIYCDDAVPTIRSLGSAFAGEQTFKQAAQSNRARSGSMSDAFLGPVICGSPNTSSLTTRSRSTQ